MANILRTAVIQADLHWEDTAKNLELFSANIATLDDGIDLIVLPEMFSTGFSMNAEKLAEATDGRTFKWMQKIVKDRNTAITGSVIIKDGGNYYNRLYFVYPDGAFEKYDKRHTFTLAKENLTYTAGKERLVVEYKGWKICPLVCYDLRFPVWARNTEDYDLLIYVANWPETRIHAWDVLLQARAIENMSYCIGVNRTGLDGNSYKYNGHTAVYDGLGEPLIDSTSAEEFIKIVELNKSKIEELRSKLKFLQDRDQFSIKD
ncbi:Carbon-nitrogen hydrolase [Gillisia sp. Hel1_33_143]|uniref:amidohydrolase n=1 Tax=Gillisia sp. Hel1_33_143 TaxID=1336796 RepID=UPI00087A7155|nr:amidohydrolase [Gillisia sp. Hel1_33_143]SDR92229.1 Carbon-nitrogen hydrolase [Gillisia sp. Hel1_33_143]